MSKFGTEDILNIGTGRIVSDGALYKAAQPIGARLSVIVYNAQGEFIQSQTFNPSTDAPRGNPNFVEYYSMYKSLKIDDIPNTSGLQINMQGVLTAMGLPQGVYHIVTNLVTILDPAAIIKDISTDRTEIRFDGIPSSGDNNTTFGLNELPEHLGNHKLELGMGRFVGMINWTTEAGNIITKLDSALPADIFTGGAYGLYINITDPSKTIIEWEIEGEDITYQYLHPNFDIKIRSGTPAATEFKTSEDILGTIKETKDKLINKHLSQSYGETEVNINYQDPTEFIHFSSYEERLLNFKYKLQQIEKYSTEISASDTITGAIASSDVVVIDRSAIVDKQSNIISSFDKFEQYMYNESSSDISGSYGEFWSNAWPKSTTIPPHKIQATTSSEATTWLTGALTSASYYDRMNQDMLSKALPQYILEDPNNSTMFTLVDMIGQHYDVVWTYIKGITDTNIRDEDLNTGIAKNLLWNVGTSLGMNLPNGNSAEDLWKWSLGTDASGSFASSGTGFESGSLPQLTSEDVTKSIWSRLINNLPYFLKTKGTKRGVKAVLACYGVPDTVIDIKEYGGPKGLQDNERQFLQEERATYALQIDRGEKLQLKTAKHGTSGQTPRAFEFRFKTNQKDDQVLLERSKHTGGNGGNWFINMHHSSSISQTITPNYSSTNIPLIAQTPKTGKGEWGRLTFFLSASNISDPAASMISASTDYLPLYNGDWWNVVLQTEVTASTDATSDNTNDGQKWQLICKSAKDHSNGKITHSSTTTLNNHTGSYSASFNYAWRYIHNSDESLWSFGGEKQTSVATRYDATGITGLTETVKQFSGSMQEIRIWGDDGTNSDYLSDNVIETHTLSPRSYVGNNFSSSYDNLWARFPLGSEWQKYNLSGSALISSSHPNQLVDWTGGTSPIGSTKLHLTASSFTDGTTGSNGTHFEPSYETYYTTIPSYPSNGISSTKVRLEDSMLLKPLSAFDKAELSEFDRHPKDTNTVGVHISLQHQINRDIAYQFGDMRVDDYIGDPAHLSLDNYPDLEELKNFYFKKLNNKPDMADFNRILTYYDVSMFEMIKRMMPARANAYVGLLIEPHILERSKIQKLPVLEQNQPFYSTKVDVRTDIFPLSMSSTFVSEHSASLLTTGGENWFRFNAAAANSSSHGQLDDTIILSNSASYNGSRYQWTQHYRNKNADGTFTVGSYIHTSNPFNTVVTGSSLSQIWKTRLFKYSSSFSASWDSDRGIMAGTLGYGLNSTNADSWNSSLQSVENGKFDRQRGKAHIYPLIGDVPLTAAERQDTRFSGFDNARYNGSKLVAGGYNEDTPSTPDGSPVISLFDTNPNQLIVTSPSVYGGSLLVPGISKWNTKSKYGTQGWDKFGNPVMLISKDGPQVTTQKANSGVKVTTGGNTQQASQGNAYK